MKVLLILEDPTHDALIAKPVVEGLLAEASISARVDVLRDPHLRGATQALDSGNLDAILRANPMIDVFVLIVDRDCDREGNVAKAAEREREHGGKLIACLAEQEVEVWLLALYSSRLPERWSSVREHCDPKELWALPLLRELGTAGPGGGRKNAMRALAGNLRSLRSRCPELTDLQRRLQEFRERTSCAR